MAGSAHRLIQVGQVIDKYELLERVGQGGMAIVYRGIDRSLKRTVAIKVLHKHLADYQEARDRFEREAQAVAKLRHENILEIFDYAAKEESEAYIVTEFIDGQTLKLRVYTQRKLYDFGLKVLGLERIQIPLGEVRALHLRHVDPQDGQPMDVWLGVDQHYLPVKMRYPVAKMKLMVEQSAVRISER